MKRTALLIALVVTLTAVAWLLPVPASATAMQQAATQVGTSGCPIFQYCMESIDGQCFCQGFYCNGRFVCGIPRTLTL